MMNKLIHGRATTPSDEFKIWDDTLRELRIDGACVTAYCERMQYNALRGISQDNEYLSVCRENSINVYDGASCHPLKRVTGIAILLRRWPCFEGKWMVNVYASYVPR